MSLCPSNKSLYLPNHIISMTSGYVDFIVFLIYLTPLPQLQRLHGVMGYTCLSYIYIGDMEESREMHYFG
jgi:hypothetical protein